VVLVVLAACGGSSQKPADSPEAVSEKPTAAAPSETPKSDAKADAEPAPATIPTECTKAGKLCLPDQKFTKRMCNDSYPSIALYLFGNGLPFTRGYLTRKTQAWNAEGGASDNDYLEFDEEVLLLAERGSDPNQMQVSGAGAATWRCAGMARASRWPKKK